MKVYATWASPLAAIALSFSAAILPASETDARPYPASSKPTTRATITGLARVIDGDTIVVGGLHVRLEGIDAPESEQTCTGRDGRPWPCGADATRTLSHLVGDAVVACEERGLDKYKRVLGVCFAGNLELNAEMIQRGLAWAFVRYSSAYVSQEARARQARVGIWSGTAQPAWEYRAQKWHTAESTAPAGCAIKGNVTANGRIYHMPWSPWYDRVHMDDSKGKRWFCSEAEAIQAGWRAARPH
ncbi:MAG: thermonuclease family protein [Proteobacteria bacterium]|nr:thermonuclease family protein [Pseudomonadota bacterium]